MSTENKEAPLLEKKGPSQIRLFKGQIILNPSISTLNFFAFLLNSCYLGLIFIPLGLLQVPMMSIVYHLSPAERSNAGSLVQFTQLGLKIILTPWLGGICDKYGRKFIIVGGMLIMNISIFITPHLPDFSPHYYILQAIQEIGIVCLFTPPLLADYIDYETKGRVAGLCGVLVYTCSFLLTVFKIDIEDNIESKYHQIGIIGTVIGVLVLIGLKGGAYHKKLFFDKKAVEAKKSLAQACPQEYEQLIADLEEVEGPIEAQEEQEEEGDIEKEQVKPKFIENIPSDSTDSGDLPVPTKEIIVNNQVSVNLNNPSVISHNNEKEEHEEKQRKGSSSSAKHVKEMEPGLMAGIKEAKNPWILVSYIGSFLLLANVGLLNFVLVTYVIYLTGDEKQAGQALVLSNKKFLVGALVAIFFGFSSDKYNKFKLLILVILSAIAATILLIFTPSAYHPMAYISLCLYGVSCSGFVTSTNQLQSKYANPKFRASVIAVGNLCSTCGSIFITIIGVYLMQYNVRIPYYLFLFFATLSLVVLGFIYAKKKEILNNL